MNHSSSDHLSQWDPMFDAYSSKAFNSYSKPSLDADFVAKHRGLDTSRSVPKSFSPTKGDGEEVKLYLCNIPLTLTKEGLRGFLSQAAPVLSVKICNSKDPEQGTTFGFVTVSSPRDAECIIAQFDNYSFGTNRNLKVRLAYSAEERDRQREIQREEEDFYRNLYSSADSCGEEVAVITGASNKEITRSGNICDKEYNNPVRTKSVHSKDKDMTRESGASSHDANAKKQTSPKRDVRKCLYCNKVGSKQCGRCRGCYCSADCQRQDWDKHQKICSSNGLSTQNATAVYHEQSTALNEDSLIISVDGMDLQEKLYYIDDLKAQKKLESQVRVMIYVVENLVMKGQAISEEDTTALINLTQKLDEYVREKPQRVEIDDCSEGLLVLLEYGGEISRAAVTDYQSGFAEASVYFIDYGNIESCKVTDLIPMPIFALELPMQCRSFHLHGFPENISTDIREKLNDRLKELTLEKLLQGERKGFENEVYQLILTDESSEEATVNQSLLSYYQELKLNVIEISSKCDSKPAAIMESDIPFEPFPKQQDFRILVSDVVSPSLFYAQIVADDLSNVKEMASMSDALQLLSNSAAVPGFQPQVGETCVAFFPDDQTWYRASIVKINNDGTVNVCYFDYGNSADIDTCYIRPLDVKFTHLRKQARKFALSGIKSASPCGKWSDDAVSLFKELACAEPCDVFCIKIDDKCHVQLYIESIDSCLDQVLKDRGYALSNDIVPAKTEPKELPTNEKKKNVEHLHEKKQDNKQKQFALAATKVETGKVYKVVAVHIEDPSKFYVHIARPELETLLGFSTLLHEMELGEYKNPLPGDSCCALFTDGDWYRAKVISTVKDESVVYFYDYGNQCTVKNTALRVMPDEVKSLEAQAVQVQIHDIEPYSGNSFWSDSGKELFVQLVSDKLCELKVVNVDGRIAVGNLVVLEDNCDVAKKLIEGQVAQRWTVSTVNESLNRKSLKEVRENPVIPNSISPTKLSPNSDPIVPSEPCSTATIQNGNENLSAMQTMHKIQDSVQSPDRKQEVEKMEDSRKENVEKDRFNGSLKASSMRIGKTPNVHGKSNHEECDNNVKAPKSFSESSPKNNEKEFVAKGFNGFGRGSSGFGNKRGQRGSNRGYRPGFGRGFNKHYEQMMRYAEGQNGSFQQHQPYPPFMYPFSPYMYPAGFGCFHPGNSQFPFNDQSDIEPPNGNEKEFIKQSAWQDSRNESDEYGDKSRKTFGGNGVFRGSKTRGFRGNARGGFKNQTVRRYRKLPQQKPPPEYFSGAEMNFIITHIETPSHFYIQEESQKDDGQLPMDTYENAQPIESIDIGMLCAAKAINKNSYFRAVIESIFSERKIFVRCADTGMHEIVEKASLKRLIPEDFMRPFKAVKCLLYNACGKGKYSWPVHVIKYFNHKIDMAEGKVKGIVRGEVPSGLMVSIKDPENSNGFLVNDLVRQGFADYMHP